MIFAFALISLVCTVFATPQVDIARKLSLRQVKPVLKTAARQFVSEYNSSGCSDFTSSCDPIVYFDTKCAEDAAANFCDYPRPFYNIVFKGFWDDSDPSKIFNYVAYLIGLDSFQDDFLKTMWPIQLVLRLRYGMSFRQIQDGMFSIFRQHSREEQTEENKLLAYQAFLDQQSSRQLDDIDDSEDSDVGRMLSLRQVKPVLKTAARQFVSEYNSSGCSDFTSVGCNPIQCFNTKCAEDAAANFCDYPRPFYNIVFKGFWENPLKRFGYVAYLDGHDSFQDDFLLTMWPIQITLNNDYGMTFREIQDAMFARFRQGPRTEANKLAAYQFVHDQQSSRQLDGIDDSEDSDVAGRRLSWKQTVRDARDQFISDYVTNSCTHTDFTSSGCDPIVFFDTNCGAGDYCQHTRPFYNKVFKGIWDQGTAPDVTKLESYVSHMDGQDSFLSTMWPIQITLNRDYGMTFREIQDAMLARFRQGPRTEANKLAAYQFVLDDEIETTEQQSEDGAVSEPSDDAILLI